MIPAFDIHGVLPPIRPGEEGHSRDRAPYPTDMLALCQRFGGTPERRAILRGLLDLRDALRRSGIVEGFQWLDGSFAEDVERLRERAPADIDVVTFGAFGHAEVQRERAKTSRELFDQRAIKAKFKVDTTWYGPTTHQTRTATGSARRSPTGTRCGPISATRSAGRDS